jgi:hypothetical protein
MYMPTTADLHDIRAQIAATHPRGLHKVVSAPAFKRAVGELTGDRLTRVPLGYSKDHPASHLPAVQAVPRRVRIRGSLATSRRFYPELLKVFKAVAPLVQFLNGAIEPRLTQAPLLVSEEPPRSRGKPLRFLRYQSRCGNRIAGTLRRRKRSPAATPHPRSASAAPSPFPRARNPHVES